MAWNKDDHFLPLPTGKIAGVAYSGGIESDFLAKLAIDTYGVDNVLFLFFLPYTNPSSVEYQEKEEQIKTKLTALGAKHIVRSNVQDKIAIEEYPLATSSLTRQAAKYLGVEADVLRDTLSVIFTGMTKGQLDLLRIRNLPELSDGTYSSIMDCIDKNSEFQYLKDIFTAETKLLEVPPVDVRYIINQLSHPFKDLTREDLQALISL